MATMTIGRLASLAGVRIDTVRYYERSGLLPPPLRRASGYREYGHDDVARLKFIRRAKSLGFTLEEIAELLSMSAERESDMQSVKLKAEKRLLRVESKIAELQRVRRALKRLVEACPGEGELRSCPILAALSDEDGEKEGVDS
jgi:MerR family copper efflux transcriptional regulator